MRAPVVIVAISARANSWWDALSVREQWLAGAAGVVACATIAIGLVILPLARARSAALDDIRTSEMVIARLRAAGPLLAARPAGRSGANVADSAAAFGLAVRRIDPDGARTRMTLEDADFEALVKWLEQVEREGAARIISVHMERRPAAGAVNAELTLERP